MKRCIDWLAAGLGLVLLSPLLFTVALLVRWRLGSPVLFRQQRLGRNAEPFVLLKFRTMTTAVDGEGSALPDHQRLTKLGRFFRRTSIDELPGLFNVLQGKMSLVGPRPLLLRYLPYFTEEEMVRFTVRPGITGLAQVSGRNEASWDQRMAKDVQYVRTWSQSQDISILLRTVSKVFSSQGVQEDPMSAMVDFDEERRQRNIGPFRELQAPERIETCCE